MEIRSLKDIELDRIYKAFSSAFEDYEMQLNKEQLFVMLNRRGFVPKLSFAAFEGDDIVAFTFNGIGIFNGIKTAYDTGTGTIKEFRGRGVATQIFEYSIPFLKKENIKQYLLEVLQHNTKAVSVYKKLGFEVSREFNYFVQQNEEVDSGVEKLDSSYIIQPTELSSLKSVCDFRDFSPSWQNSFFSIKRKPEDFVVFGAFTEKKIVGYCVLEPNSGDITQIAVDNPYRRKGIASHLLTAALKYNQYDSIKIINTDIRCSSITGFLKSKNISVKGKQFEMIKEL